MNNVQQLPQAKVTILEGEGHVSLSLGVLDQMLDQLLGGRPPD
jgi:hypothetical protein